MKLLFIQRAILIHIQFVESGAGRSVDFVLINRPVFIGVVCGDRLLWLKNRVLRPH